MLLLGVLSWAASGFGRDQLTRCCTWESDNYRLRLYGAGLDTRLNREASRCEFVASRDECTKRTHAEEVAGAGGHWGPDLSKLLEPSADVEILSGFPSWVVRRLNFLDKPSLALLQALDRGERLLPNVDGSETSMLVRHINEQVADALGIPPQNGRLHAVYKDKDGNAAGPLYLHHDSKEKVHDIHGSRVAVMSALVYVYAPPSGSPDSAEGATIFPFLNRLEQTRHLNRTEPRLDALYEDMFNSIAGTS
jgi:hypothetical protein